ncbi:uncharacterized protein LOC124172179 [Ischnura elegans]|uniref:uncharacterized protein LOC124172179 n=1 Tax=Ischnura elegans TaxID=197161 RepID=UPI001ED89769|nr:uncharacterized protein LOC124172179 [Ischnura elegans]
MNKALMNLIKPDSSWDKLFVRYISPKIDDYAIAKKLEIDSSICEESDLETFIAAKVGEKRYRVAAKKRYPNEPIGDSSDLEEGATIEEPPKLSKKLKFDAQSKMAQPSVSGLERKSKRAPDDYADMVEGSTMEESPLLSRKPRDDANCKIVSIIKSKPSASALEGGKDGRAPDVLNKILKELREIRATLTVDVADIKERLAALSATVQQMRPSTEGPNEVHDMKCLEKFKFPIGDFESLVLAEEEMSTNQDFKFCMVEYLLDRATLPSKEISDKEKKYFLNRAVNGMCCAIMSDELATQFSMKGRSEEKQSFEERFPMIICVVLDATQKKFKFCKDFPIDLITVKRSMGEWFRLSKNRTEEGKNKRRLKKINEANGL